MAAQASGGMCASVFTGMHTDAAFSGGASLELLEGKILPGVAALNEKQ
jgi:3-phosphoglycerate kinase